MNARSSEWLAAEQWLASSKRKGRKRHDEHIDRLLKLLDEATGRA
jgi:hypothetical protein